MSAALPSYNTVGVQTANTSLSTVQSVTINGLANGLLVQAISQNIRYTIDGTNPTTTLGFRLTAGNDPIVIPVASGIVVKFLQETATAELQYQQVNA